MLLQREDVCQQRDFCARAQITTKCRTLACEHCARTWIKRVLVEFAPQPCASAHGSSCRLLLVMMAVLKLARLCAPLSPATLDRAASLANGSAWRDECCEASNLEPMSYQSFALATDLHRLVLCERQLRWCAAALASGTAAAVAATWSLIGAGELARSARDGSGQYISPPPTVLDAPRPARPSAMSQHSSASAMAPECGARFVCQERSSSDWPSRRFGPLECTSGPWTSTASAHRSAHRSSPAGSAAAFMACTCQGGRFCYARYHPFSAKVSKLLAPPAKLVG